MPNSDRRRVLILVTVVVEALFLFAAFETLVTLLAVPEAAQNEGLEAPTLWIPWFVGWTAIRVAAGTSAMVVRQPAFWMLPFAVLLWEIHLFQIGWRSTMDGLSGLLDHHSAMITSEKVTSAQNHSRKHKITL